MQQISICITTYNRFSLTTKAVEKVLDHPFVGSVVILDDASPDGSFRRLQEWYKETPHVYLIQQSRNVQMQQNKADAIALASFPFCAIIDSDNEIGPEYLDALAQVKLTDDTIFCPDFARPHFSFKKFSGRTFDKTNVKELASDDMGNCALNCCNYVVPVKRYLEVYKPNPEHKATDTVYFNHLWLQAGYKFHIVDGMEYDHLVGPQSGFLEDVNYNMAKSAEMRQKIMEL